MSYRVAFVSFRGSKNLYPVNCHRGDIIVGDEVYVSMIEKQVHKKAVVHAVEYLNWDCKNAIYCLVEELKGREVWGDVIERRESDVRFHTKKDLIRFLLDAGWKKIDQRSSRAPLYYWLDNQTQTARLRFHGLGIDIQIFDFLVWMDENHEGRVAPQRDGWRIARHRYYHSGRCIFEFVADFSDAFLRNEDDFTLYLTQIGHDGSKRSDVSSFPVEKKEAVRDYSDGCTLSELYDIMSDGSGGPAYLGDGIYLNSDGSSFE